jgi:hypothetical protein
VIDPAWREADFERLWAFIERLELFQAGFTILTPLPGTAYFDEMRPRLRARQWAHFDMHHLLWEPAVGPRRFFELYCETWRRSVLNLKGRKGLIQWMREVDLSNAMFLMRALRRTQRLMDAGHYMHSRSRAFVTSPAKVPGSIGAFSTTSSNTIVLASPLARSSSSCRAAAASIDRKSTSPVLLIASAEAPSS